jgi:hypothetical protein
MIGLRGRTSDVLSQSGLVEHIVPDQLKHLVLQQVRKGLFRGGFPAATSKSNQNDFHT